MLEIVSIALDSDSLTYAIRAFHSVSSSPTEPCAAEKLALYRLYLYLPTPFTVGPTVESQYQRITDESWRKTHQSFCDTLLVPFVPRPDPEQVLLRARELSTSHPGENNCDDCKILAECELAEMNVLLSYDNRFVNRLGPRARRVRLLRPTEYWAELAIPKGTKPDKLPHFTNPMSEADWWQWKCMPHDVGMD
jgi:hypothetical protein